MITSTVESLASAKSILVQELAGMVSGKVEEALNVINTYNIAQENKAVEAEKLLAELDVAAEQETSAFAKMMWPEFREKKLAEIESLRSGKKPVPTVEELSAFYLNDTAGRILFSLGIKDAEVNKRGPKGDGAFSGIWGTYLSYLGKNYMVANYRILPDGVKEASNLKNPEQWVVFCQNAQDKWYVGHTFEAKSPSNVVLYTKRLVSGDPTIAQTNLEYTAWYANNLESTTNLLTLSAEKLATKLAKQDA